MNLQLVLRHDTTPTASPDPVRRRRTRRVRERQVAVCYHCASNDTMEPFSRPSHVFILSRLIPGLRRRYCRTCTRHFLAFIRSEPASPS